MARIYVGAHLLEVGAPGHYEGEYEAPEAETVASALSHVFDLHPRFRFCILNEQGLLRRSVTLFLNGQRLHDAELEQDVCQADRIHVLPALMCDD
jgi:hypothetical protein